MKKIPTLLLLMGIGLLMTHLVVAAGRVTGQAGMMSQGKIRTCLSPKLVGPPPPAWFKRAAVKVQLTGVCEAASCTILRCNSNNKEIEENENFEKKCKAGKIGNPNCMDKIDANKKKNEKSVEKKPGCKTIGFMQGGAQAMALNTDVLGEAAANELPNGPVNVTTNEGDYTAHVEYTYYAVGDNVPVVTVQPGTTTTTGANNSQQLAQLNFTNITTQVDGKSKDCTKITWDPYGRVFDALSLEPLEGVDVTLIDNATNAPVIQEFEGNSTTTGEDGVYNILVEKTGMYKLIASDTPTHSFSTKKILHSNYNAIYSDIYYPGSLFEEVQGIATHHDIPLQPKGEPYRGTVATIMTADEAVDMGEYIVYTGKTNFPMAQVCMVTETGRTLVGECVFADKFGEYSITIDKNELPLETLVPQAAKVDLTSKDLKSSVESPVMSYDIRKYDPILNHVEGYIYDKKSSIIPYAHVQVHLRMDDSIFFEADADKDGFIAIYSESLPANEFYLSYSLPGGGELGQKSTSEFVKDNIDYIRDNKLNLILSEADNRPITTSKVDGEKESIIQRKKIRAPLGAQTVSPQPPNGETNKTTQNALFILIGIAMTLIIGGVIVVFVKSKKTTSEY